jgi:hypothetical protein
VDEADFRYAAGYMGEGGIDAVLGFGMLFPVPVLWQSRCSETHY